MITVGITLVNIGVCVAIAGTIGRRRRWRCAEPFAGGERAAPEPAIVPNHLVYMIYAGWSLAAAGALVAVVAVAS